MKLVLSPLLAIAIALPCHADAGSPEIINAGKGGNSTRHLLKRVDAVLAESQPDLVVLMVGTNDALNSRAMVPIDEYRRNVQSLIDKFRAAGSRVMLMTILPCHAPYLLARHGKEPFAEQSPEQRIAAVNRVLSDLAAAEKIPLIDTHRVFSSIGEPGEDEQSLLRNTANSGSTDGVHPTADGYRVIATAVFQAITGLEKKPQRILCFGDSITYGAGMEGAGTATGNCYPGLLARLLDGDESAVK